MVVNDTIAQQLGMAGASAVIVSIIFLGIVDRKLVNQLSIRLIFALALADLLNHIGGYLSATQASDIWNSMCYALAGYLLSSLP
ncbi:hypothetical protein CONCODRAFT_4504 [Conidiobolus coronatus NRRL 28638]|uniref:Uncharacterized protein n=1 Tax=Conidiobolus coronatus (strain ATCC 28846 / CBS 209.66 / NRRL 28638) TaxID=796925 RepID=A0A137PCB1_CONC2|nr:hypothetical protein CONCODRAFT_4504 [Conidiobolus coronatus NRRL 28638]|eukprot:KXN72644.1 hypothetical protein CONCODRAFT_4504 [Conidiobolus coronatus NRRL 28638]